MNVSVLGLGYQWVCGRVVCKPRVTPRTTLFSCLSALHKGLYNECSTGYNNFGMGRGGGGGGGGSRPGGTHCVHMRGLPFRATAQDIAYFFKPIRPVNINILFDNSGRPSGEADVDFECHEDAMRAMRRDKNNMDHRYIELFMNSAPGAGGFKGNRNFNRNY